MSDTDDIFLDPTGRRAANMTEYDLKMKIISEVQAGGATDPRDLVRALAKQGVPASETNRAVRLRLSDNKLSFDSNFCLTKEKKDE